MGLPDIPGLSVLKRLREWSQTPVLVVSVRHREEEKIAALDNGANDYITKPFGTGELLARLRVILRSIQPQPRAEVFRSGPLSVDLTTRTVKVEGRTCGATATEYSLLLMFVRHAGKVLTHGQLLREVWDMRDADKTGPLRVYVGYLREKIKAEPGQARAPCYRARRRLPARGGILTRALKSVFQGVGGRSLRRCSGAESFRARTRMSTSVEGLAGLSVRAPS